MSGKIPWKDLFVKQTFFTQGYKYYLSVIAASTTTNAQLIWSGWVESKVRLLVAGLEDHPSIALAHPFNKGFERVHKCQTEEEVEKAKSNLEFQIEEIPTNITPLRTLGTAPGSGSIDHSKQLNGEAINQNAAIDGDQNITDNGGTMVYTTTWYIGLELVEGK